MTRYKCADHLCRMQGNIMELNNLINLKTCKIFIEDKAKQNNTFVSCNIGLQNRVGR